MNRSMGDAAATNLDGTLGRSLRTTLSQLWKQLSSPELTPFLRSLFED